MPERKSDAPDEDAATAEPQPDALEVTPDAPLPPAGAESEPEVVEPAVTDPPETPGGTDPVTVDVAAADDPEIVEPRDTVEPDDTVEPRDTAGRPVFAGGETAVVEEEAHEEEPGRSFAARLLTLLVVLLLGAALGIWGAPRLAPLLPSGMAPVAAWLEPGGRQAEDQMAALQAQVDQRISGLEAQVSDLPKSDDVAAQISSAVDDSATKLSGDIDALQNRVDQLGGADAAQRIARLESSVEGQAAELNTLKEQLSGTEAASGQLSSDAAQKIDVYRAELDGLRAEVGGVQDKVAALGSRIDEVSANADRQIEAAQKTVDEVQAQAKTELSTATTQNDVALIRSAIAGGQPFAAPLEALSGQTDLQVAPELQTAAPTGVATMAELRDEFPTAAHAAIQASIVAGAGPGVMARTQAFLQAQVASRSLSPQQGDGTDAVLSRMEAKLGQDDLKGALAESAALPSEASAAMADWLNAARLREAAVEGLATLETAVPATN